MVVVSGRARLGPIERPPAEGASWTPQPFCVMRLQTSGPDGAVESVRVGMGGAESSDPTSKILTTTIHYSTPKGLGEVGGDCPIEYVQGFPADGANGLFRTWCLRWSARPPGGSC